MNEHEYCHNDSPTSTKSPFNFWEQWMIKSRDPRPSPKTIYYGDELGEGDYVAGAITSKGVLIADEFDEIDKDTEVTMLYVRRRNGQMDLITHDTVYMNVYPIAHKSKGEL